MYCRNRPDYFSHTTFKIYITRSEKTILYTQLLGFWTFFHRLVFYRTRRFGNWICFRPQVKVGEKTFTQLGHLERANLNLTETDPVSETSCSLEYQTMEKSKKPSNSVYYTPSSEPFRINNFIDFQNTFDTRTHIHCSYRISTYSHVFQYL
jgi:hypothetical protein